MDLLKASWKTTVAGIVSFLFIVTGQLQYMFDDNPDTNINWNIIISAVGVLWMGLASRDNNVTSKMAGAEPPDGDE